MAIRLIWAQDRNRIIGTANRLPWRIPEDARRFRALTSGGAVVMGRKTWESLPADYRPLPDRENWVLTRDTDWADVGARRALSLDVVCRQYDGDDLWVAGGGDVYALALPIADECFVTEVDADFDGDAWAPELGPHWRRVPEHPAASGWQTSGRDGLRFRYSVFRRGAASDSREEAANHHAQVG